MCVLGQLLDLRHMFLCYNRYLISHFISTLRNVRLSWPYCEGYCLLGYMMWPPPVTDAVLLGFPLFVLESCIPLGTWILVYRSCYLCCHHLWVATMLVWFTKTCNLLFSAVDVDMLKCAWSEIHIPFLQKSVEVWNFCVSQNLCSCVASESFVFRKHDVTAVLCN
jgi:hypothetical protein